MLAQALSDLGAEVHLLAQSFDPAVVACGYPLVSVPARPTHLWALWHFAGAVRRYITDHPDMPLISFDRIPGVPFIRAGDGTHDSYMGAVGIPRIHRLTPKHALMLSMERAAYTDPALRLIFANSRLVVGDLRASYGVPDQIIRILYTGLPSRPAASGSDRRSARTKLGLDAGARVLLFAGHNYERKGLPALMEALRMLKTQSEFQSPAVEWTLLVAGRGDTVKYEQMSRQMGLAPRIRFLGSCPLEDVFAASDLLVLPTRYDPFARVCLEAARSGLPVVTSRRNGFAEWIEDGKGFVQDDPMDVPRLASILQHCHGLDLPAAGRNLRERTSALTIEQNARDILSAVKESLGV